MKTQLSSLAVLNLFALNTADAATTFKSGTYMGVEAGYSRMSGQFNQQIDSYFGMPLVQLRKKTSTVDHSLLMSALLGYRYFFTPKFMGGVEVTASHDTNQLDIRDSTPMPVPLPSYNSSASLTRSYTFTPALILGAALTDKFLAFLKLGASFSKFSIKSHDSIDTFSINDARTIHKVGLHISLGGEYALTDRFSTRFSLGYERFSALKYETQKILPTDATTKLNRVTVRNPSAIQVKVGLLYKF